MLGSYYSADYYRNPMPYYAGRSATQTVPGWGVLPRAAGPARLGVGQIDPSKMRREMTVRQVPAAETWEVPPIAEPAKGIPWWVWVAAPGVLVGGLALAINMGWIGEQPASPAGY